ncbi:hypothetical protein PF008_g26540 [Phytophthora fragariae]|uniref:Uncharacterized protein n=1 Tax=Phytophthora fragariae TaxID=53985 RepID=A0A6G0QGS1_9STRA|nr:hypothetical protein PF008_g26540 [Phytophthora fragariae]
MQEGEREEAGRGSASRASRRVQGLPPEETKSLDEVKREARKANAAKRKAADEKKKVAAADEQSSPGLDVQDAHQVLLDDGPDEDLTDDAVSVIAGDEQLKTPALGMPEEEVKILEDPAWRLEGSPNEVSLVVDGVSDSPRPDEEVEVLPEGDVVLLDKASLVKVEKPLVTVQEDKELPGVDPTVPVLETLGPLPIETPRRDLGASVAEIQARDYVAEQVRRWERAPPGRISRPSVEYTWPAVTLDTAGWQTAILTTSGYLRDWSLPATSEDAWVVELLPERRMPAMAQDLTAATIPPGLSSPRESVAALQTLLCEAGFEFTNLVPEWFKTRASKIHRSKVYKVVADLLQLLGVEMLEWQLVTAKASGKSVLPEGVKSERPPRLDYHAEDAEGDLFMNDYESDLLGREFVMRFRTLGIRTTRSPRGSSQSEPDAKRPQAHPPQPPSLSSLPLYASSGTGPSTVPPSEVNSVAQMSVSRKTESNSVPSQSDASGQSSVSQSSFVTGSLSSRDESSGSSLWSYEGGHMPYVGYHPMVMTANGAGGFMPSGPEMGMYVQQTNIPPVQESKSDVGDVDMMDSERDVKMVKASQRRTRRKDRRPDTSSDDESSGDSHYSRRRERGRRRSSKRTSGRHRSTSRYSERSNRSGYSVKSTGSTVAAMESMQKMAESMAEMKDSMASVEGKVAQVQKQSTRVEKENVPPLISSNVANFVPMSPEVVEALRAEAALNERQRMEAALGDFQAQLESEKNRQALEVAEEKARLESEGKRQALDLEATRKELLALQEASERDREAAINVQKYYASQLREKRAATTQSNPRGEVPMPSQVPAQTAQTTADNHFAAQLQATLRNFQQAKVKNDAASWSRSATQVKTEQSFEKRGPPGRNPPGGSDPPKRDAGKSGSSRRDSARKTPNEVMTPTITTQTLTSRTITVLMTRTAVSSRSRFRTQRVSGLGGVPTIIRSRAQVKGTIGPRVVYILDLWVANIGE